MLMVGGGGPGLAVERRIQSRMAFHYLRTRLRRDLRARARSRRHLDHRADGPVLRRALGATCRIRPATIWYIATFKGDSYKWEGAPDIQPCLHPLRAEPVINFLKRAFDAEEVGRHATPDGVIHHATLKIGRLAPGDWATRTDRISRCRACSISTCRIAMTSIAGRWRREARRSWSPPTIPTAIAAAR